MSITPSFQRSINRRVIIQACLGINPIKKYLKLKGLEVQLKWYGT
jgi:hypothetical protein